MHASEEQRKDIFFLRANDILFHPHLNPVGNSLITDLIDKEGNICEFTDVDLEDKKAYFIIAAPSTWPPFAAKMDNLVSFLDYVKPYFKIIFIYLQEAHADDLWPLGYGITSSKTVEERWERCDNLMKKWPKMAGMVDKVYIDNMSEQFNSLTGSWPEACYFANRTGYCTWKSRLGTED